MNILFEEFIAEFIKNNMPLIDENLISVNSQVANKYVFKDNNFKLRPDIIVKYKNSGKIIIDTKYKKLNHEKSNYWVSSADIYQMFMY
jgi:5-methylcytosine-specific restriction enzyme subunit McrC